MEARYTSPLYASFLPSHRYFALLKEILLTCTLFSWKDSLKLILEEKEDEVIFVLLLSFQYCAPILPSRGWNNFMATKRYTTITKICKSCWCYNSYKNLCKNLLNVVIFSSICKLNRLIRKLKNDSEWIHSRLEIQINQKMPSVKWNERLRNNMKETFRKI